MVFYLSGTLVYHVLRETRAISQGRTPRFRLSSGTRCLARWASCSAHGSASRARISASRARTSLRGWAISISRSRAGRTPRTQEMRRPEHSVGFEPDVLISISGIGSSALPASSTSCSFVPLCCWHLPTLTFHRGRLCRRTKAAAGPVPVPALAYGVFFRRAAGRRAPRCRSLLLCCLRNCPSRLAEQRVPFASEPKLHAE